METRPVSFKYLSRIIFFHILTFQGSSTVSAYTDKLFFSDAIKKSFFLPSSSFWKSIFVLDKYFDDSNFHTGIYQVRFFVVQHRKYLRMNKLAQKRHTWEREKRETDFPASLVFMRRHRHHGDRIERHGKNFVFYFNLQTRNLFSFCTSFFLFPQKNV